MVIACILFLIGILIGLSYGYIAIILATAGVTALFFPLWLIWSELTVFAILIWIGYLFSLQSGFLVGSYLGMQKGDR